MRKGRRAIPKKVVQGKAMLQRETLNHIGHLEIVKFSQNRPFAITTGSAEQNLRAHTQRTDATGLSWHFCFAGYLQERTLHFSEILPLLCPSHLEHPHTAQAVPVGCCGWDYTEPQINILTPGAEQTAGADKLLQNKDLLVNQTAMGKAGRETWTCLQEECSHLC